MFLWNINTVKCNVCSRREPTIVPVKLSALLLKLKMNLVKIYYGVAVASLRSSAQVNST